MGYIPKVTVQACPACHSVCGEPKLKWRGFFSSWVLLECQCGVAGMWRKHHYDGPPWNTAANGWSMIAGERVWPLTFRPPGSK